MKIVTGYKCRSMLTRNGYNSLAKQKHGMSLRGMRFFPMDIKQQHTLKVGDLVRYKHHIFDGFTPVHLVTGVSSAR